MEKLATLFECLHRCWVPTGKLRLSTIKLVELCDPGAWGGTQPGLGEVCQSEEGLLVRYKHAQSQLSCFCKSHLPISWTPMWLHLSKKASLIWRGTQPTPSLSQRGVLSHGVEEKGLFTFRDVASFSSFHSHTAAGPSRVPNRTSLPLARWWQSSATSPGERGGNHLLPALKPGPSSQTTPRFSVFSLISSHRQNFSALLLALSGASCRNHWHLIPEAIQSEGERAL